MNKINSYKTIIFDCDGVIFQSNIIKSKVFAEVLKNEDSNLVRKFIAYHRENGGVSRYEKFEYFYKILKKDKQYLSKTKRAIKEYSNLLFSHLLEVKFVPGFLDILKYCKNLKINLYIISGGDQNELRRVFKVRNLYKNFNLILGSPTTKFQHMQNLSNQGLIEFPTILFGDSFLDMNVAIKHNVEFCFVEEFSEWENGINDVRKFSCYSIYNFKDPLISYE